MGNYRQTERRDRGTMIGVCLAVIAIVVAVITVVVSIINGGVDGGTFASTDTKYVIEYPEEFFSDGKKEEDILIPNRVYVIYTHDGDNVNGKMMYYEYDDATAANEKIESLKKTLVEAAFDNIETKGKYIVITASEEVYGKMTMDDVESERDFVENMKKMHEEATVENDATEPTTDENVESAETMESE